VILGLVVLFCLCCAVFDALLESSLSTDANGLSAHQSERPLVNDMMTGTGDRCFDVDLMDSGSDVFYDANLFVSTELDDTDLWSGLEVFSDSQPVSAGCGSLVDAGNATLETDTLQLLSEAGIQQPEQRQIRLHSELARHLSTSPDNNSAMLSRDPSLSSESELVRILTAAVEDGSSVSQFVPQPENIPVMSSVAVGDVPTDSELVRQLSLCPEEATSAARSHQQQHQRVALVQPTVTRPVPPSVSVKTDMSQLIIHQPSSTTLTGAHLQHQPQAAVPVYSMQQSAPGIHVQPAPRQIVITTQAPAQAQQVPQISLQQLQQVSHTHSHSACHIAVVLQPCNI